MGILDQIDSQFQLESEPESNPTNQPAEFSGSGPGLDWGDLIDNPVSHAIGSGFEGFMTGLDTFARPVRTLLGTGDVGQSFDSIFDPSLAPTVTALRQQYMPDLGNAGGFGKDSEGNFDFGDAVGDTVDTVADLGVGILTDPLSLLSFGATSAGKTAVNAGTRFLEAASRGAQEAKTLARAEAAAKGLAGNEAHQFVEQAAQKAVADARTQYAATVGRALPESGAELDKALNPSWYQQVRQGDVGLKIGLPFGVGPSTEAVKLPGVGQALAMAANPIETGIETVVKPTLSSLAATTPGRWVVKKAQEFGTLFSNPSIRGAFGQSMKYGEDVAQNEAQGAIMRVAKPVNDLLNGAGVKPEDWHLVEDVMQAYSPEAKVSFNKVGNDQLESTARSFVNPSEANKALQDQFDEAAKKIGTLPVDQRAAIFSASEKLRQGYDDAFKVLQSYDPGMKRMGSGILSARDEVAARLESLQARRAKLAAGEIDPTVMEPVSATGVAQKPSSEPTGIIQSVHGLSKEDQSFWKGNYDEIQAWRKTASNVPEDYQAQLDAFRKQKLEELKPHMQELEQQALAGNQKAANDLRRISEKYAGRGGGAGRKAVEAGAEQLVGDEAERALVDAASSNEDVVIRRLERTKFKDAPDPTAAALDYIDELKAKHGDITTIKPAGLEPTHLAEDKIATMTPQEIVAAVPKRNVPVRSMTPAERAANLYRSPIPGMVIPNKQAMIETLHEMPGAIHVNIDGDSLKIVNDVIGHEEAGDVLLSSIGKELQGAINDVDPSLKAFHVSGDEYKILAPAGKEAEAAKAVALAQERMQGGTLRYVTADGKVFEHEGAGFSYGIGNDAHAAESGLKANKSAREAAGTRTPRGEVPKGLAEVTPSGRKVQLQAPPTARRAEDALRARDAELADLDRQIEAATAEYSKAKAMADRLPSYAPGVLNQDIKESVVDRFGKKKGTAPAPAGQGTKSFEDAEGVPLTNKQAIAAARSGKIGSQLTGFEVPTEAIPVMGWAKNMLTKEGRESMKAAGKPIDIFTSNPVETALRYFEGSFKRSIGQNAMNRALANTYKTIPVNAWTKAVAAAEGGGTFEEAKAAFSKLSNGVDLESVLPKETVAGLKNGTIKASEALTSKGGIGDGAFRIAEDFIDGEAHFVPAEVERKLASYKQSATERLGQTLSSITGSYQAFLRVWKPLQVLFPASQVRNQLGDLFRMVQAGVMDGSTGHDMATLFSKIKGGAEAFNSRDFSLFNDLAVNAGNTMYKGQPVRSMAQLAELAAERGVINTGRTAEILSEEATRQSSKDMLKTLNPAGGALESYKNLLVYKENVNRLSAFAARLRAGDDVAEAAMRVEEALYNQRRISPAANFLRQTGIAPFISWTAKNIPAQVEWAMTHPGSFAGMMRAYQLLTDPEKGGGIPEGAVPDYVKDKYNIVVNKGKDGKWQFVTDDGIIPLTDMTNIMKGPSDGLKTLLGPLFKLNMGMDAGQFLNTVVGKPFSEGAEAWKAGQAALGVSRDKNGLLKPGTSDLNPLVQFGLNIISPAKIKELDVPAQIDKSIGTEKSAFGKAKSALKAAQQISAQAGELQLDPDTAQTIQEQLQNAQIQYRRAQKRHDAKMKELMKAKSLVEAVSR